MLYIVPSRGRPHNIAELIEAWDATREHANLWVCVDDDDPAFEAYQALKLPRWAVMSVGPRLRLGATLNLWAMTYLNMEVGPECVIGFMGDDHRPRTPFWDTLIQEAAVKAGPAVIYGNDLIHGANLATAVAMTSDVVGTLGYMVPPGMTHLYLDNAWMDMGRAVGSLIYRSDVVIEHVHPIAGKAEWDDTYREVNSGGMYEADGAIYDTWRAEAAPYAGWREKLRELGATRHG